MLTFYAKRFSAVEINSTFYRLPDADVLASWTKQVPPSFLFAFKAPGSITHRRWSSATPDLVKRFVEITGAMGPPLGPLLFQFPPFLKKNPKLIEDLLALLPPNKHVAFEFRHASWFDADIFKQLAAAHAPLVFNDTDVENMPFVGTGPWGYLRLRKTVYSPAELRRGLKQCSAQKWNRAFIFFKHEDLATGPALADRWMALSDSQARSTK